MSTCNQRTLHSTTLVVVLVLRVAFCPEAGRAADTPPTGAAAHPPIPVALSLPEPGFVTLVIEDPNGMRIRNLVSETPFPAGANTVWWDGLDDRGRDPEAAAHAVYHVPGKAVAPGRYTVRGLFRQAIDLRYEFSVYNPGRPPWRTASTRSQWLTNHSAPGTLCFLPAGEAPVREGDSTPSPSQMLIGSYVAEGGSGLAWVDLDGHKLHGQMWVGGVWTGAEQLARDQGPTPIGGVYAYVASSWKGDKYNGNQAEIRLHKLVNDAQKQAAPRDTRMGSGEDPRVLNPTWKFPDPGSVGIGGLAAWNGLVVVGLPKLDALLLVDATRSCVLGTIALPSPRGLLFDVQGRLLAVSSNTIVRLDLPPREACTSNTVPRATETLVREGLDAPQQLALDAQGRLYVSDAGRTNQVKVFTFDAAAAPKVRAIGTPGPARAGPYDPAHMYSPKGIAIDERGRLWVAEENKAPKRVSVWTTESSGGEASPGTLVTAFYGPPQYGGGGVLDPVDKTRFYHNGMTFRLDWEHGTDQLVALHWRPGEDDFLPPRRHNIGGPPDTPIYLGDRRYFTDCFTAAPTGGSQAVSIWRDCDGVAVPAASFGNAAAWEWLVTEPLLARVPWDPNRKEPARKPGQPPDLSKFVYVWSDLNEDGRGQPEEVQFAPSSAASSVMVGPDLAFLTAGAKHCAPKSYTPAGVPVYDLAAAEVRCPDTQRPTSSGGGQAMAAPDGWTVLTTAPQPFRPQSVGGASNGVARWSYPSLWPGLHASHIAPLPEFPGELIGTTRLIGAAFELGHDNLTVWAINGNKGNIYLFTTDGLFVATLFQDCRAPTSSWTTRPTAERNMSVADLTNGEESFWPSIARTRDGKVYLVSNYPAIIRVDGLETVRRLPALPLEVTPEMLATAAAWHVAAELQRQAVPASEPVLRVALRTVAPTIDGNLADWPDSAFVTIDTRQKATGDWGRRPLKTRAALTVCGDRLYAAFRTGEPQAIENAASTPVNLFKTGGALDLMLGTDPKADPQRRAAVAGDVRLLVSRAKGKPIAVLYRAVVPGATGDPVAFSSPLRTVAFDAVEDVSTDVVLAQGKPSADKTVVPNPGGDFEFSIPLAVLGLQPVPGLKLPGDVGVLRGSVVETTQRVYWHNKATGLVSDIPSEAELVPRLWGNVEFTAP